MKTQQEIEEEIEKGKIIRNRWFAIGLAVGMIIVDLILVLIGKGKECLLWKEAKNI